MIEMVCPGRCNTGYLRARAAYEKAWEAWRLAEEAHADWRKVTARSGKDAAGAEPERYDEPEQPTIRPWRGQPIWCGRCAGSIGMALSAMDDLMSLRLTMADGYQVPGQPAGERIRHTKASESSSPSPGQDDLDELLGWLGEWEKAYRGSQGWTTTPYRGVAAPALTSAISWWLPRLNGILAHPDFAEKFGKDILAEHYKLQQATRTRPATRHKPLPCPGCQHLSLFLHDTDQTVRCNRRDEGCGNIITASEYARLEEEAEGQVAS